MSEPRNSLITGNLEPHFERLRPLLAALPGIDAGAIESRMRTLQADIVQRNRAYAGAGPEAGFLEYCALMLACHNALREAGCDHDAIWTLLQQAFVEPRRPQMKGWLSQRFKIDHEQPQEAFQRISENFKPVGDALFGDTFHYVQPIRTDSHTEIQVRKCFFNDFFRRNGAAELTGLMCVLDTLWGDELNGGDYNARFERPTILSRGDDACRFVFFRREKDRSG